MADSDKNLNIGINIQTTKSGADPAQEIAKLRGRAEELSKTTKDLQKNVDAEAASTAKATVAKKGLKDAARGLALEFPLLGRVMNLALNPISLAVAGLIGAFTIWRTRVNELTRSLGGIEMPDITEDEVTRINRYADGWKSVAESMGKAATGSAEINKTFANVERLVSFYDKLGLLKPGQADSDRAAAATMQADALEASARAVLAASGTPGSPADEKALGEQYAAAAAAAMKEKGITEERLGKLQRFKSGEMSYLEGVAFGPQFAARYGATTSVDDAIAMEQGTLNNLQIPINQYASFQNNSANRAGRRAAIGQANADLERAAALRDFAAGMRGNSTATRFNNAGAGMDAAAQALASANGMPAALGSALQQFIANQVIMVQAIKEAEARIAELRQQIGNTRRP